MTSDLITKLRDEQARLQRIIDKNVTVKRKRALLYRRKMAQQAADALESARGDLTTEKRRVESRERELEAARAKIERLTARLEANERAIESYQNDETGIRAENERLRSELRDGATYLVECGKQFASIGDHVMQSGCYDVAKRLKDSAALTTTGEDDD